jgi:hypothetical protein
MRLHGVVLNKVQVQLYLSRRKMPSKLSYCRKWYSSHRLRHNLLLVLLWFHGEDPSWEAQLAKKFPAFCGTRRFIAVFTTAHHCFLFWAKWSQSTPHLLIPWSRVLLEKPTVTQLVKPFMEPEGSLPCSQQPATGPCPEPDDSSPHPPYCILILS